VGILPLKYEKMEENHYTRKISNVRDIDENLQAKKATQRKENLQYTITSTLMEMRK
jgi:hypothetical protein